ncbi:hypothetical protein MSG28_014787, partial [Choristoneura fumiferana]
MDDNSTDFTQNAAAAVETGGKSPVSALNELGVRVAYTVLRQGGPAHCPSFTVAVTVSGAAGDTRGGRGTGPLAARRVHRAAPGRPAHCPSFTVAVTVSGAAGDTRGGRGTGPLAARRVHRAAPGRARALPSFTVAVTVSGAAGDTRGGRGTGPLAARRVHRDAPGRARALPSFTVAVTVSGAAGDKSLARSRRGQMSHSHTEQMGMNRSLYVIFDFMQLWYIMCMDPERVADMTFEGWGHSKREARVSAAKACLAALLARAGRVLPAAAPPDFTSDEPRPAPSEFQCLEVQAKPVDVEAKRPETPPGRRARPQEPHQLAVRVLPRPQLPLHVRGRLRARPGPRLVNEKFHELMKGDIVHSKRKVLAGIVMTGERLLTMSCSDKVCRWCVVGMQGALLARLLRPVYLHSLVLGSLLHPHHMYRLSPFPHYTASPYPQGERLLTMSCSDKVCRWCVVGMQGALLARLLRPVYLHSLVLGSLLHPHHMY